MPVASLQWRQLDTFVYQCTSHYSYTTAMLAVVYCWEAAVRL